MASILTIDTGHLTTGRMGGESGWDSLLSSKAGIIEEFQWSLQNRTSPITLPLVKDEDLEDIKSVARYIRATYKNVLLLGIGGSALGAKAIVQFLKGPYYNLEREQGPLLFVLDNLDPVLVSELTRMLDFKETALIYVSKSGSTPETAASFIWFLSKCSVMPGPIYGI